MAASTQRSEFHEFFRGSEMAGSYKRFRPSYPPDIAKKITNFVQKTPGPLKFAVDVGCGSGQSTIILAEHVDRVLGVDISSDQIEHAKKSNTNKNVDFKVGSCGDIPVESGSVDLITVGTAIHWFDLQKFFPEVDRILRPGGCLAIYSYQETEVEHDEHEKGEKINQMIKEVEGDIMPNNRPDQWSVSWDVIKSKFRDLELPYKDSEKGAMFSIKNVTTVSDLIGLMKSYSESKEFIKRYPAKEGVFDELGNRIMSVLDGTGSPATTDIKFVLPVFMALARKPVGEE